MELSLSVSDAGQVNWQRYMSDGVWTEIHKYSDPSAYSSFIPYGNALYMLYVSASIIPKETVIFFPSDSHLENPGTRHG